MAEAVQFLHKFRQQMVVGTTHLDRKTRTQFFHQVLAGNQFMIGGYTG